MKSLKEVVCIFVMWKIKIFFEFFVIVKGSLVCRLVNYWVIIIILVILLVYFEVKVILIVYDYLMSRYSRCIFGDGYEFVLLNKSDVEVENRVIRDIL